MLLEYEWSCAHYDKNSDQKTSNLVPRRILNTNSLQGGHLQDLMMQSLEVNLEVPLKTEVNPEALLRLEVKMEVNPEVPLKLEVNLEVHLRLEVNPEALLRLEAQLESSLRESL